MKLITYDPDVYWYIFVPIGCILGNAVVAMHDLAIYTNPNIIEPTIFKLLVESDTIIQSMDTNKILLDQIQDSLKPSIKPTSSLNQIFNWFNQTVYENSPYYKIDLLKKQQLKPVNWFPSWSTISENINILYQNLWKCFNTEDPSTAVKISEMKANKRYFDLNWKYIKKQPSPFRLFNNMFISYFQNPLPPVYVNREELQTLPTLISYWFTNSIKSVWTVIQDPEKIIKDFPHPQFYWDKIIYYKPSYNLNLRCIFSSIYEQFHHISWYHISEKNILDHTSIGLFEKLKAQRHCIPARVDLLKEFQNSLLTTVPVHLLNERITTFSNSTINIYDPVVSYMNAVNACEIPVTTYYDTPNFLFHFIEIPASERHLHKKVSYAVDYILVLKDEKGQIVKEVTPEERRQYKVGSVVEKKVYIYRVRGELLQTLIDIMESAYYNSVFNKVWRSRHLKLELLEQYYDIYRHIFINFIDEIYCETKIARELYSEYNKLYGEYIELITHAKTTSKDAGILFEEIKVFLNMLITTEDITPDKVFILEGLFNRLNNYLYMIRNDISDAQIKFLELEKLAADLQQCATVISSDFYTMEDLRNGGLVRNLLADVKHDLSEFQYIKAYVENREYDMQYEEKMLRLQRWTNI